MLVSNTSIIDVHPTILETSSFCHVMSYVSKDVWMQNTRCELSKAKLQRCACSFVSMTTKYNKYLNFILYSYPANSIEQGTK